MARRISASEAARSFSEILNRVRYRGEQYIVERAGEPICRIEPIKPTPKNSMTVGELVALLRELPRPDEGYLDVLEEVARKQPKVPKSPWGR